MAPSARAREATKRASSRRTPKRAPAKRAPAKRAPAQRRSPRKTKPTTWRISSSGARFGIFSWAYCRQTKGSSAGLPLALEPWQLVTMSELLQVEHEIWLNLTDDDAKHAILDPTTFWPKVIEWRQKHDGATSGLRIHREGLLGIGKKNGKSTKSAALGIYLTIEDGEPGAEVYSTASVKEQARIVFRQATEMVEASPALLDRVRVLRDRIESREDASFYKVVAADGGSLEGINPHGVINDEIHAQKTRGMYDTLRTATIAREQPILFSITTAGVDVKGTIGGELYRRGAGDRKPVIKNGMVVPRRDKQRSFYFRWYQADPDKIERKDGSIDLDEVLNANPASWITRAKIQEEAEVKRPRGIFLRYHANVWTTVEQHWLRAGAWEKLRGKRGDKTCVPYRRGGEEEILKGEPVVITVDIGLQHDTTAITISRPPRLGVLDDPEDPIAVKSWVISAVAPGEEAPPCHEVIETEEPIRLAYVVAHILRVAKRQRVLCVAADPYKFETQLQEFEDLGFLSIRFDQTAARMVPASEGLFLAVANELIAHDGDEVLESHLEASTARDVGGGRWRLDKKLATSPMDAAIATAMGVSLCQNEEIVNFRRPTATVL